MKLNEDKIPPPTTEEHFIITDNNSTILAMVPDSWIIPLTIISHVKGGSVKLR
jgi:hypothetical protein